MASASAIKALTRKPMGFSGLACPVCGEKDVTITLDLADLSTCHCGSCDDDFAATTAVQMLEKQLARWRKVLRWIDLAADVLAAPETESE